MDRTARLYLNLRKGYAFKRKQRHKRIKEV